MKLSTRFILLIWQPSHLEAPPGHLLWHHILVPGSQCPWQGCKRGFMRRPVGFLLRWNTYSILSLLIVPLFDHNDILSLLLYFDCFLHIAQSHTHQFFQIKFLMLHLVGLALIHYKSLTAPRGGITTTITWTLINHTQRNILDKAFECSLRRREVSEMNEVRHADKELTTRVRSLLSRVLSTDSTYKMKNNWHSSHVMCVESTCCSSWITSVTFASLTFRAAVNGEVEQFTVLW